MTKRTDSMKTVKIKELFQRMLEVDEDDALLIYEEAKAQGLEFELEIEESEEWDESEIEGYSEFPTVTQECKLLLGNIVVAEWDRRFGIEMIDVTHIGGSGKWCPLRLDDNEGSDIENLLELFDIDIIDPDVPEPTEV